MKIEGTCDPRFKRVREIFAANFENGIEIGAAVAATIDGKTVFDLWGGYADKAGADIGVETGSWGLSQTYIPRSFTNSILCQFETSAAMSGGRNQRR